MNGPHHDPYMYPNSGAPYNHQSNYRQQPHHHHGSQTSNSHMMPAEVPSASISINDSVSCTDRNTTSVSNKASSKSEEEEPPVR